MRWFTARARVFMREEDGPTATEYAVMLALIVVGCIVIVGNIGSKADDMFSAVENEL